MGAVQEQRARCAQQGGGMSFDEYYHIVGVHLHAAARLRPCLLILVWMLSTNSPSQV